MELKFTAKDARNQQIAAGTVRTNKSGSFHQQLKLPDNLNLGCCYVQYQVQSGKYRSNLVCRFQCEEFRRPEFTISSSVSAGDKIADSSQKITVTVNASYFAGGPLESADVEWRVGSNATSYNPPGWSDYRFGCQSVMPYRIFGGEYGRDPHVPANLKQSGYTDSKGDHAIDIDCTGHDTPASPVNVTCGATVKDINQQTSSTSSTFLVHPAEVYGGIKVKKPYFRVGEPVEVSLVSVGLNGKTVSDIPMTLKISPAHSTLDHDNEKEGNTIHVLRSTSNSGDEEHAPVKQSFTMQDGGSYNMLLEVYDKRGRVNHTQVQFFVAGGQAFNRQTRGGTIQSEQMLVLPDREEYVVGEEAELIIQPGFYPCEGHWKASSMGVFSAGEFKLSGEDDTSRVHVVKLRIDDEAMIPSVMFQVHAVGTTRRADGRGLRPAFADGCQTLKVAPVQKKLRVSVKPKDESIAPGAETEISATVRDFAERPVQGAEVTLVVVDEAVLALTGYELGDIGAAFRNHGSYCPSTNESRNLVYLVSWDDIYLQNPPSQPLSRGGCFGCNECCCGGIAPCCAECACCHRARCCCFKSAPGGGPGGGGAAGPAPRIVVRSNFDALASFQPSLITAKDGTVTASVKMPDSLTRYRVWCAAAVGDDRFGLGESSVNCLLPLMLRLSPPRFLNFGDEARLSLVIQNQTNVVQDARIAMRVSNLVIQEGQSAGHAVTLQPQQRVELGFEVCTKGVGTGRVQVVASSATFSDAAEMSLPVYTPCTSEAFATYGEVDGDSAAFHRIDAPANCIKEFGSLDVSMSSTALQSLTDSLIYLWEYPFDCCEQIASRCLSIIASRDVLEAFSRSVDKLPSGSEIDAYVKTSLQRIAARQCSDGGWGYWGSAQKSSPFVSCHVALFLAMAQRKGYEPNAASLQKALSFLSSRLETSMADYNEMSKNNLRALAVYVRMEGGVSVEKEADALYDKIKGDDCPLDVMGWLLSCVSSNVRKSILSYLRNRVNETAETANFITKYEVSSQAKMVLLHSSVRTDAIILDSLLRVDGKNLLIVKLVKGLLNGRKKGRWHTTQENCWVLLAMDRYFRMFEKNEPDFEVNSWFGDSFLGSQQFKGRSVDTSLTKVPMTEVMENGIRDEKIMVLSKNGRGRLYYRVGLNYAPTDFQLPAAEYGFAVQRTYEHVSDPSHVVKGGDGVWHVKVGELVRVILCMTNVSRRYHVALVDKLPAGFEPLNPALKTTGAIPLETNDSVESKQRPLCRWRRTW